VQLVWNEFVCMNNCQRVATDIVGLSFNYITDIFQIRHISAAALGYRFIMLLPNCGFCTSTII
jgi:hypothetical protein